MTETPALLERFRFAGDLVENGEIANDIIKQAIYPLRKSKETSGAASSA